MLKVDKQLSRILAIDPGLHNTGLAFFTVDLEAFKIVSIETALINSKRLRDLSGLDDDRFEDEHKIRLSQKKSLKSHLEFFRPDTAVCESPFFNALRPGSFMVLTRVTVSLLDTVTEFDPNCTFLWHAPQYVKKSIGVAGLKGKEVVEEALSKMEIITSVLKKKLSEISEHERDAIAVGYSHLSRQYKEFAKESK